MAPVLTVLGAGRGAGHWYLFRRLPRNRAENGGNVQNFVGNTQKRHTNYACFFGITVPIYRDVTTPHRV